jgi:hypothetical protein
MCKYVYTFIKEENSESTLIDLSPNIAQSDQPCYYHCQVRLERKEL